jgi:hypothetical protein
LASGGVAWERDGFQQELSAQLALREPGSDLASFTALLTQAPEGEEAPWNQTAIAVEALF